MNIEQSLKHFKWRLSQDKIIPNDKDIDAFNQMVTYVTLSEQKALDNNRLFTKLLTYILTFNSKHYGHNVKKVLDDIELCLNKSVWQNILNFKINIPQCNLSQLWKKHDDIYLTVSDPPTVEDIKKIEQAHKKQFQLFADDLKKSLETEYTQEQLLAFITKKVTEFTIKYQNYD